VAGYPRNGAHDMSVKGAYFVENMARLAASGHHAGGAKRFREQPGRRRRRPELRQFRRRWFFTWGPQKVGIGGILAGVKSA